MSDLFIQPSALAPATKARSVDINTLSDSVKAAFDKLPDEKAIKGGTFNYGVDTGSVINAYVVTLNIVIIAYFDGMEVAMRPTRSNTGACTLNVNGIGAIPIKRNEGTDPREADIPTGGPVTLRYNAVANAFYLAAGVNSQAAGPGGTVLSVNGKTGNVVIDPTPYGNPTALAQVCAIALCF